MGNLDSTNDKHPQFNMCIRSEHSEENFPKSILTMFYGFENASGSVFRKGKNSKKK